MSGGPLRTCKSRTRSDAHPKLLDGYGGAIGLALLSGLDL